jgi:hypothetical protein
MDSETTSTTHRNWDFHRAQFTGEFTGGILAGIGIGAFVMGPLLGSYAISPGRNWFLLVGLAGFLWWIGHAIAIRAQRNAIRSPNPPTKSPIPNP